MTLSLPVTDFLDHALSDAAKRLIKLEQDMRAYLPHALSNQVHAGGLHGQNPHIELVLLVPHSAAAARIRQSLPSLLAYLQNKGWVLSSLRIKIQPDHIVVHDAAQAMVPKQAILGHTGVQCLKKLHAELAPSPLRDALQALLAKHYF